MEIKINDRQKMNLAIKKIGLEFPKTGEGRLYHGIVSQSVFDLFAKTKTKNKETGEVTIKTPFRSSAITYLNGDIPHAEAFGICPEWIRSILKRLDIDFKTKNIIN